LLSAVVSAFYFAQDGERRGILQADGAKKLLQHDIRDSVSGIMLPT
jgi:hypothetical protein